MSQSPFPGPIAPENNPPIMPQYFQPSRFEIIDIDLGITTTITTSDDMNYVIGQAVRLLIPETYGSFQLNELQGLVIEIPAADQVVVDINSTNSNQFIPNPTYGPTKPQIIAIGDVNSGIISSSGRDIVNSRLPGSFTNISPGVFL
jgi:hypothetical protein